MVTVVIFVMRASSGVCDARAPSESESEELLLLSSKEF